MLGKLGGMVRHDYLTDLVTYWLHGEGIVMLE